ncbi:MAG TPA: signal peptidase I [Flavobacteriales bacterium]|jgi:signal peptidase I|nr:signal peptidase I [Flavobacteriales bacterium]MBK7112860.1 signal peptidase I [Flavobacteriales bacterium]MBK8530359.1 signal peptidase I [Flavobacteriales bacterium]MBK8707263.1 signal peptidase I [Flavobacteriales bacterium]HQW05152.1 signal peptidase I [Flavobacteriales bacterium]
MVDRFKRSWAFTNEWVRAFLLALVLLIVLHSFVLRWVIVESTSMFATLHPGDLVLVQRWPLWTGLSRGDVVVFRDPLKDDRAMMRRPLLVKRIVGMPGDLVELRRGRLMVNDKGEADPNTGTIAYVVRLRDPRMADSLLTMLGLPSYLMQSGRNTVELPLNEALADRLSELPYVINAEPLRLAHGAPRHIFPFSPRYPWNGDDYGPIHVPAKGDTLHITVDNLPLYDRLIAVYEGHKIGAEKNALLIDGRPLKEYVVEQDYYFVLGDSRHHSADSRYWGFVPADHITGRAGFVLWGKGVSGSRSGRDMTPL